MPITRHIKWEKVCYRLQNMPESEILNVRHLIVESGFSWRQECWIGLSIWAVGGNAIVPGKACFLVLLCFCITQRNITSILGYFIHVILPNYSCLTHDLFYLKISHFYNFNLKKNLQSFLKSRIISNNFCLKNNRASNIVMPGI